MKTVDSLFDPSPIIALPCQSVSQSLLLLNFAQIFGFVKVFTWISMKQKHQNLGLTSPYFCLAECRKSDNKKYQNNSLKNVKNGNSVYSCLTCDFTSASFGQMKKHIATDHVDIIGWFSCDECSYLTRNKHYLSQHKIRKHRSHKATSSHG